MSATTTLDDLIRHGLTVQTDTHEHCGTCEARIGEPCTVDCDTRGEQSTEAIGALLREMPGDQFRQLLAEARKRNARDDETPGFHWAWRAVDIDASERGLDAPVGI